MKLESGVWKVLSKQDETVEIESIRERKSLTISGDRFRVLESRFVLIVGMTITVCEESPVDLNVSAESLKAA